MTILKGVRVVEFTHMVAGPACGQVLGDLGAEVIKVEPPEGDITRRLGPALGGATEGMSALFATTNRNKRSVRLDLRHEEDAEKARALALGADVVVTNVGADMLEKAGLAPAQLRISNPALIAVEISAFGPSGALGTDGIAQAAMGLMSITGAPDGATYRTGASVVDVSTGVWAALGVLAALERRRQTGRGDTLSVSLADVCLYMQYSQLGMFAAEPELVRRNANHSVVSCTPVFETADGRIIATILHDRHWRALCTLLGRPDVLARADLADNAARCRLQGEIERLLNPDFAQRSRAAWIVILRDERIPCGPERTYAEVARDEDLLRRGMLYHLEGREGSSLQVRSPVSFLEQEQQPPHAAPALGDGEALLKKKALPS
jgi:CoA:oxalate CoA-transferase